MIQFYKLASWADQDSWKNGHASTYGFEACNEVEAVWFEHDAFLSGDYCGSGPMARSNVRMLQAAFPDLEDVLYHVCIGSHGSQWVRFDIEAHNHTELASTINGLEDYPVIDEDDMSELEREDEAEAWEHFGRKDFVRALSALAPHHDELFDRIPDVALAEIWSRLADRLNINGGSGVVHEQGGVYFYFDDLARAGWIKVRAIILEGIGAYRAYAA